MPKDQMKSEKLTTHLFDITFKILPLSLGMAKYLLLISLFGLSLADQQSVAVMGKLVCNGKPQKDIRVKLYDIDTCWFQKTFSRQTQLLIKSFLNFQGFRRLLKLSVNSTDLFVL